MKSIEQQLDSAARRMKHILIIRSVCISMGFIVPLVALLIFVDWVWRIPSWFRWVFLVLVVYSCMRMVLETILPTTRLKTTRMMMAHRVERLHPDFGGRFATAVDFTTDGSPQGKSSFDSLFQDRKIEETSFADQLFKPFVLQVWVFGLLGIIITILFVGITFPSTTETGLSRLFWPGTHAAWPPRTSVSSLMETEGTMVHGRGTPLYLRAENTTEDGGSEPVFATIRSRDGIGDWSESRMMLTHQGDGIHERMINTDTSEIEFSFHTADARTSPQHIELIDLPEVERCMVDITSPEWVKSDDGFDQSFTVDPENRRFTTTQPALHGSTITLTVETNRPIHNPEGPNDPTWLSRTFGIEPNAFPGLTITPEDPNRLTLNWTLGQTNQLVVSPHDSYGLESSEPWLITILGVADGPPSIQMTTPLVDQSVLPTAIVPLSATASDDIEVTSIGFELRSDSIEPDAPTPPDWLYEEEKTGTTVALSTELDLAELEPETGSIFRIRAQTRDNHPDGTTTRKVDSATRNIQIIDQTDFLSMLRQRLNLLEQRIETLEARQATLQQAARTGVLTTEDKRDQASIGRSLSEQIDVLESIEEELAMNRTSDRKIESLSRFTTESLERAMTASDDAMNAMDSSDIERTVEQQERVRFELQEIISMIGDDENSWIITRQLDQLMESQKRLREQTALEAGISAGQERSTMTPEQNARLDSMARAQLNLTEQARGFIDALRERADSIGETDDSQSKVIEDAIREAERLRLVDHIRESAERISDARMESALSSQQQALDALSEIQTRLSNEEEGGIRELVRKLEKLEDSIRRLVTFQEEEIAAITISIERSIYTRRDTSMLRLRTNTLNTAAEARRSGDGTGFISRPLEQAAGAQGRAVSLLRSDPIDGTAVLLEEKSSLEILVATLEEVTSMADEARQEVTQGERRQLASLYGELAEREVDLWMETKSLLEKEIDRRSRFESRRLSGVQEKIRIDLAELLDSTPEISDSRIFRHAHEQIDLMAERVVQHLKSNHPTPGVLESEARITARLNEMKEVLTPDEQDDFSRAGQRQDGSSSGSESGGSPQMIPPITELRLLRSLQTTLLENTRVAEENRLDTGDPSTDHSTRLAEQQQELVDLGVEMLERLQPPSAPDRGAGTVVPRMNFDLGLDGDETVTDRDAADEWPDLDQLLDLESDGASPSEQDVEDEDSAQPGSPLQTAISSMREAANNLSTDQTGLVTQRAQMEAIRQIDALIEMAQQQSNQQSTDNAQNGQSNPGAEPESSTENQPRAAQPASGSGDEANMPPPGEQPVLGGVLDETSSEWGALPSRVRDMLRQGRQESYSRLYEQLTAEYYRRLAEDLQRD